MQVGDSIQTSREHSASCPHGHGAHGHAHSHSHSHSPHLSHEDPWAHPFICCDMDHAASTSTSAPTTPMYFPSAPQSIAGGPNSLPQQNGGAPASTDPLDMFCCEDEFCPDNAVECCEDPSCGNLPPHGHQCTDCGLDDLEAWACTKEGCQAIQQYLDCCSRVNCNLPVHPAPTGHEHANSNSILHHHLINHPPHQTQQVATVPAPTAPPPFQHRGSDWSIPQSFTPSSNVTTPGNHMQAPAQVPVVPEHVCHWQNCHRMFTSMPDLLAHVASDHLGAPGFATEPAKSLDIFGVNSVSDAESAQAQQQWTPVSVPTVDPLSSALSEHNNDPFSLEASQALLSCLWDDCLPLPECKAPGPEPCPAHAHMPAHPLGHSHTHTNASGEPFSPQTMLRHVLEEHLGVPGSIIGLGDNPAARRAEAAIKEQQAPHQHRHHLPTPSSTQHTPSPPPGKSLICLWPGCTHREAFADPGTLMAHLSDEHVGKGKDSYTCLWDGCDRTFRSRQKVLRHLQSHTGHRPFICSICDQAFGEAAPLAAHMRRHAQEKPFKCEHPGCSKAFATSSSLTIHMRTHNGEKPFVCPHCGKGFVEASNLTKHIRTHTGERPFACAHPGCNKRFPRPDQLKRHMAVHDRAKTAKAALKQKKSA